MLYATVRHRKITVKSPMNVIQNGVNVDFLQLDLDDEWQAMTEIICLFRNGELQQEVPYTCDTEIAVPWACLTQPGELSVSITGYVHGKKVMTTAYPDSFWTIVPNGPTSGEPSLSPAEWPGWGQRKT